MALLADAFCWTPDHPQYTVATPLQVVRTAEPFIKPQTSICTAVITTTAIIHECLDLEELVSNEGIHV